MRPRLTVTFSSKMVYAATEEKPFDCWWKEKIIEDLEWANFQCGAGYDAVGPPGPVPPGTCPCCPVVYTIPCE